MGPARVREPQEPAHFVEGLPRRVVEGAAQFPDARRDVVDQEDARVPAGDDESDEPLRQGPLGQFVDREVPDDVVDAVQRLPQGRSEGLRRADADGQGSNEAGASRNRDRVNVRQGHPRLVQGGIQRRKEGLQVCARGDFGDDAAVARVLIHRGRRAVDEQIRTAHEADTRLVAR